MTVIRRFGLLAIGLGTVAAMTPLLLAACARLKPVGFGGHAITHGTTQAFAIPDSANPKMTDFRLRPPVVEELSIKKGTGGNVTVMAKFAPDRRLGTQLELRPDGRKVVLHDDGRAGDERAGDRVFSGVVPMDFDGLVARQRSALAKATKRTSSPMLREFAGREVIKRERLNPALLERALRGDVIKFIHVGADVVDEKKSLLVTDVGVVEDPSRTFNPCASTGTQMGKWTFGYLMTQLANQPVTGINPSDFTLRWLKHWLNDQTVNGFTVSKRPNIQGIIDNWPKLSDGRLDLARAPMRLLAIVNRIDLAENLVYGNGSGGEGRFVFGVLDTAGGGCSTFPFTVIFEYGVPHHTCTQNKGWANQWLALDGLTLGSTAYNSALEAITEQFAAANADPSKPNGSAINQLRTDEIALAGPWELREFRIFSTDSDAGQLRQVTVKQTPDRDTYNTGGIRNGDLGTWINANAGAIKLDKHSVPADLPFPVLEPFLGGASPNGFDFWNAIAVTDNDARFHFSVNTCNACHGRETNTGFTHVSPAPFGSEAQLSGFLKGDGAGGDLIVTDPVVSSTTHAFNDLARRAQVLDDMANHDCFGFLLFQPILMTD